MSSVTMHLPADIGELIFFYFSSLFVGFLYKLFLSACDSKHLTVAEYMEKSKSN